MIFILFIAKAHKILGPFQLGNMQQVTVLISALEDLQLQMRDNGGYSQTGKAHKMWLVSLRLTKCCTLNRHCSAHLCLTWERVQGSVGQSQTRKTANTLDTGGKVMGGSNWEMSCVRIVLVTESCKGLVSFIIKWDLYPVKVSGGICVTTQSKSWWAAH